MPRTATLPSTAAAAPAESHLFTGTSGWAYVSWKPGFYPANLSSRNFLAFYATQFNSVEVNYTFTKLPAPEQLAAWIAATPPGFRFTFKAPQRITHILRLRDTSAEPLAEFLASLKPVQKAARLGAILFQLPPNFKATPENQARLSSFLRLTSLKRFATAFEFRHPSWFMAETFEVLRKRNAALCIADTDDLATPEVETADTHIYFRLRQSGGYSSARIKAFAEKFLALSQNRDVYAYFRHEDEPTGALNARSLLRAVGRLNSGGQRS